MAGTTIKQSYVYEVVNRLTSADERVNAEATPRWTQSYSYDRWGNRTSLVNTGAEGGLLPTQSTPGVDGATNRLAGLSYDAAGNLLSPGGRASYVYDAENRVVSFESLQPASYGYDGEGRRVKRVVLGPLRTTISYVEVYDAGGQLIAEYNNQAGFGGQTTARYITADHLGSTRVVTKADGSVKGRYDYLPYGEELGIGISGRSSAMLYGSTDATRQKFTGKERDSESGLDYFGARYYSSTQGRFISSDPVGGKRHDPQTLNLYSYVLNNPLRLVDPTGLSSLEEWADAAYEEYLQIAEQGYIRDQKRAIKGFADSESARPLLFLVAGIRNPDLAHMESSMKTAADAVDVSSVIGIPNDYGLPEALFGLPNIRSAGVLAELLDYAINDAHIDPQNIDILAHSDGTPTLSRGLTLLDKKRPGGSNVFGEIGLVAPNTKDPDTIKNIARHAGSASLMTSNNDKTLNKALFGHRTAESWHEKLKDVKNLHIYQTGNTGHSLSDYRTWVEQNPDKVRVLQ